MVSSLDALSGGRVVLGIGAGWVAAESAMLGVPFAERGPMTDEHLRAMQELWTARAPSFSGTYTQFSGLTFEPKPVQKPHPPIWIGGHSKAALRRAARLGDGWHPVGANAAVPLPPSELRQLLDELYRLTEAEGRDPKSLTISYKAPVYDLSQRQLPGGERRPFSGSPAQIAEDIAAFARLGVSEIVFDFRSESLAESLERMESFGPVIRQG
jgi:probable F420-dependent oxidoreductase